MRVMIDSGYEKSMWVMIEGDQEIMLCTRVDDSFVMASTHCPHKLPQQDLLRKFDGTADMDAKE